MDFMNLNQSAHGDREFGYIETRLGISRKTVVGHWRDPQVLERIGTWSRAACGWREAQSLGVARFGDNMRSVAVTEGDKVDAQIRLGISVDGFGVGDLVDAVTDVPESAVDALVGEYDAAYEVVPELRQNGVRREALRDAARIEAGLRAFLDRGGYAAFTDTFEDLHGLTQLPGIAAQRLMADGYGFAGEGDWKTAALVRVLKVMSAGLDGRHVVHGGLHLRPDAGRREGARRAHARGVPVDRRRNGRRARSIRSRSAVTTIRCGSCSPPRPAPPSSSRCSISAAASGWSPTRST